jgi:CheY-like chemotaxis protein
MYHVLLIEDNLLSQAVIEDLFRFDDLPGELVCTGSAEEALRILPTLEPLVVLMDLMLPGMSGIEATRIIKGDPKTRHLRVWAITARSAQADIAAALAAGCDGYFTKPIDPQHLAAQLHVFESEEVLNLLRRNARQSYAHDPTE